MYNNTTGKEIRENVAKENNDTINNFNRQGEIKVQNYLKIDIQWTMKKCIGTSKNKLKQVKM